MIPSETDRAPTPQQPGVWLPLSLAIRILDCYFGNGPRHSGSTPPAEIPAIPQNAPSGGDSGMVVPRLETYHYGMHPQGVARSYDKRQENNE